MGPGHRIPPPDRPEAGGWPGRLLAALALLLVLVVAAPALAAPVDWQPVPEREAGRQWWDAGSLRRRKDGHLSVLSRFLPAPGDDHQAMADLYVMDIDCATGLYRDTAVNGIPRPWAAWRSGSEDPLTASVIEAACSAVTDREAG